MAFISVLIQCGADIGSVFYGKPKKCIGRVILVSDLFAKLKCASWLVRVSVHKLK